mmetsp:Transcript_58430/g.169493  ORF Transcript_58430/g.169493 Transcript_58430/m.169493 type:complete len:241 (-) Transcript_58430:243-965(-)
MLDNEHRPREDTLELRRVAVGMSHAWRCAGGSRAADAAQGSAAVPIKETSLSRKLTGLVAEFLFGACFGGARAPPADASPKEQRMRREPEATARAEVNCDGDVERGTAERGEGVNCKEQAEVCRSPRTSDGARAALTASAKACAGAPRPAAPAADPVACETVLAEASPAVGPERCRRMLRMWLFSATTCLAPSSASRSCSSNLARDVRSESNLSARSIVGAIWTPLTALTSDSPAHGSAC